MKGSRSAAIDYFNGIVIIVITFQSVRCTADIIIHAKYSGLYKQMVSAFIRSVFISCNENESLMEPNVELFHRKVPGFWRHVMSDCLRCVDGKARIPFSTLEPGMRVVLR